MATRELSAFAARGEGRGAPHDPLRKLTRRRITSAISAARMASPVSRRAGDWKRRRASRVTRNDFHQVARRVPHGASEVADRGPALGQRVKVAHRSVCPCSGRPIIGLSARAPMLGEPAPALGPHGQPALGVRHLAPLRGPRRPGSGRSGRFRSGVRRRRGDRRRCDRRRWRRGGASVGGGAASHSAKSRRCRSPSAMSLSSVPAVSNSAPSRVASTAAPPMRKTFFCMA